MITIVMMAVTMKMMMVVTIKRFLLDIRNFRVNQEAFFSLDNNVVVFFKLIFKIFKQKRKKKGQKKGYQKKRSKIIDKMSLKFFPIE